MQKLTSSLTKLLAGISLISAIYSCEKPKIGQTKETQTSQEDTLLKTASNFYLNSDYNSAKKIYTTFLEIKKNKNDSLGIAEKN